MLLLFKGIVKDHLSRPQKNVRDLATAVIEFGEKLFLDDVVANMTMGLKGAEDVLRRTCNGKAASIIFPLNKFMGQTRLEKKRRMRGFFPLFLSQEAFW